MIKQVAIAKLPTVYGIFQIIIYQSASDGLEHAVFLKGKSSKKPTLVRIHSQCLTGDIFSSLRCDCREQLVKSLTKIGQAKNALLLYLNQEGRGIGLSSKIKAYALQDKGLDTVEANKKLGLAVDRRNYQVASEIIKDLGISQIALLTNNPDKVTQLKRYGIKVSKCLPLEISPNQFNKNYLRTKKEKLGHKLNLV